VGNALAFLVFQTQGNENDQPAESAHDRQELPNGLGNDCRPTADAVWPPPNRALFPIPAEGAVYGDRPGSLAAQRGPAVR